MIKAPISLQLKVLDDTLAVCRLSPTTPIPQWAFSGPFFSVTRTTEELSIVCGQDSVPSSVKAEKDWRAIKVQGPLDFGLTGILASLASPLAEAGISIFAISTFDTDYLLVRSEAIERALEALRQAGHVIDLQ